MESKKKQLNTIVSDYIDTHVHLDLLFDKLNYKPEDIEKFITDIVLGGKLKINSDNLIAMINISCFPDHLEFNEKLLTYLQSSENPRKVYFSFGCHPHSSSEYNDEYEKRIINLMSSDLVIAWGECGLDYFKLLSPKEIQIEAFRRQLIKAVELGKPIVIHTRHAEEDTMVIMKELIPKEHFIHVHCFTGSLQFAKELIDYYPNLFIGFTGCITFKKSIDEQNVVKGIPIERIVIETDGPFMSPEPLRGETCHSGMIPFIVEKVATLKDMKVEEVYEITLANAKKMYNIN
jgi:TatD DNase family protein